MFSRPVSSGWKPVPTSRREPTRPVTSPQPAEGSVMRERIFSSVLLPAPLWPIRPTTSPWPISTETSRSAHRAVSSSGRGSREPAGEEPRVRARPRTRDSVAWPRAGSPSRYRLPSPCVRIATSAMVRSRRRSHARRGEVGEPGEQHENGAIRPRHQHEVHGAGSAPSTAQRKPSTTPTIGLIAESVRHGSSSSVARVDDRRDEQPQSVTRNGTT